MKALLPIVVAVFSGFFAVGIPLAVLPGYVRESLALGNLWVGIVLGLQSVVTLVTRHYAGTVADARGPATAARRGIVLLVISGSITLLSLSFQDHAALAAILVGRIVLGAGESLLITGALAWGVGLLGPARTGSVMAWSGMAMYAAIAASAPLANLTAAHFGFTGVMAALVILPAIAGIALSFVPVIPATGADRLPFYTVVHRVWKSGIGLALSAVSFVGLAGFASLLFRERVWPGESLVMTLFGAAYITARLFFAGAPDRFGGKRVALVSLSIAALGQGLVWQAKTPFWALVGAALTGFGYSLTFPAFGVEAVKSVEPQFKGVALGAYVAFFDLSLALASPLAGLVAEAFGYSAVYFFGLAACVSAFVVALQIKSPGRNA
jgi:MFS family permease